MTNGIRLILTPGHTPGSQMVLVDTEGGVYCLAGDNAFYFEPFYEANALLAACKHHPEQDPASN